MDKFLGGHRRQRYREGVLLTEQSYARIDLGYINEHARLQADALVGFFVPFHSELVTCARVQELPTHRLHLRFRQWFKMAEAHGLRFCSIGSRRLNLAVQRKTGSSGERARGNQGLSSCHWHSGPPFGIWINLIGTAMDRTHRSSAQCYPSR
jgi:hypothetical protein